MIATLSPKRLASLEARVPRHSLEWRWIVTSLATVAALRLYTSKTDDITLQRIVKETLKALEAVVGREVSLAFIDCYSELSRGCAEDGEVTADFLGEWAVSIMSTEQFLAEYGPTERDEIRRIGVELSLILAGRAGWNLEEVG